MHARTRSWRNFALALALLALLFAFVSRRYVERYSLSATAALAIFGCFFLLLTFALAPAFLSLRAFLLSIVRGSKRLLFLPLWCLPYLLYAWGAHDFHHLALLRLIVIAAPLPVLYLAFPVGRLACFSWQDAVNGAWLFAAVLFHGFRGVWTLPVQLDFMSRLFPIAVASWTWSFVRPIPHLGYTFRFSRRVGRAVALNFVAFAAIALPLGLLLRFIAWHPRWPGLAAFCLTYIEIFLFIALLEELFFRGFLQSLLEATFRSPWRGQLLASILFGLSHVFHAPVPNWRYVLLASAAGWFYGSAFRTGGGVLASALLHALVDTGWRTWFLKM